MFVKNPSIPILKLQVFLKSRNLFKICFFAVNNIMTFPCNSDVCRIILLLCSVICCICYCVIIIVVIYLIAESTAASKSKTYFKFTPHRGFEVI